MTDYEQRHRVLRNRVERLEQENERLLEACRGLLSVHTPERGEYAGAVLHMADVVNDIGPARYAPVEGRLRGEGEG